MRVKVKEGGIKLGINEKASIESLATLYWEEYYEGGDDNAKQRYMALWELAERLGASIPDLPDLGNKR